MLLYYSGCGNSQYVASQLATQLGDNLVKIDPADPAPSVTLCDGEALGIVCPVYAWAVPRLVSEYIGRLTIAGSPSQLSASPFIYLACTCGDNVGRTPERFDKCLRRKGWHLDAAFSFVMPETYINLPGFHLDTAEGVQRKYADLDQRLPWVVEKIKKRERIVDVVRGKMPRFNSYVVNPLFYGLLITDRKFHVSDACVSCGLCEKVCPLHNITLAGDYADPKASVAAGLRPVWHGNCTNCMACYHHCPQNAIHFGKATLGKGQYYFGHQKDV